MSKSHIGIGHSVCPICGTTHSEIVLMQTRMDMPPTLDKDNFVEFDLCPEHKAMADEYLALVECSNADVGSSLHPKDAVRTGNICHVRRSVADNIFNVSIPPTQPMCYVEMGVIDQLRAMTEELA